MLGIENFINIFVLQWVIEYNKLCLSLIFALKTSLNKDLQQYQRFSFHVFSQLKLQLKKMWTVCYPDQKCIIYDDDVYYLLYQISLALCSCSLFYFSVSASVYCDCWNTWNLLSSSYDCIITKSRKWHFCITR